MAIFKGKLMLAGLNAKTRKGDDAEFATAIMYLAPHRNVAGVNLCPTAEKAGCVAACLFKAGRGAMSNVEAARARKTEFYRDDRAGFLAQLVEDLERFVRWCAKRGVKPVVRLNGTSDIQWEVGHPVFRSIVDGKPLDGVDIRQEYASIFAAFPEVQFYDYTKIAKRLYRALPANYDLTLSYSEASADYAETVKRTMAETGCRVAVVYRTREAAERSIRLSALTDGPAVIDGDDDDIRFTEPKGVIVALYAKGPAKNDRTGFVVD